MHWEGTSSRVARLYKDMTGAFAQRGGKVFASEWNSPNSIRQGSRWGSAFCFRSSERPRPASGDHRARPRLPGGVPAMMKIAMSPAAGALLRALIARSGVDRNRILLTDVHS